MLMDNIVCTVGSALFKATARYLFMWKYPNSDFFLQISCFFISDGNIFSPDIKIGLITYFCLHDREQLISFYRINKIDENK